MIPSIALEGRDEVRITLDGRRYRGAVYPCDGTARAAVVLWPADDDAPDTVTPERAGVVAGMIRDARSLGRVDAARLRHWLLGRSNLYVRAGEVMVSVDLLYDVMHAGQRGECEVLAEGRRALVLRGDGWLALIMGRAYVESGRRLQDADEIPVALVGAS